MRKLLGVLAVGAVAGWAAGQPPAPVPDRYKVPANLGVFPQETPQKALGSAVRALDKDRVEYLAAHLLDPAFVDARVSDRALALELQVDRELRAVRDQRRPGPSGERLPFEPAAFADVVRAEARVRAFRQVTAEIRDLFAEHPGQLKDLRRFARLGEVIDPGDGTAKTVVKDAPDRAVFAVKRGDRWFLSDFQQEPPPKAAVAENK